LIQRWEYVNGADLKWANLNDAQLSETQVQSAQFAHAIGLTPELQARLRTQGAILPA